MTLFIVQKPASCLLPTLNIEENQRICQNKARLARTLLENDATESLRARTDSDLIDESFEAPIGILICQS